MALNDTFRGVVTTISGIFDSMKMDVKHAAFIGQDGFGKITYGQRVDGILAASFDPLSPGVYTTRRCIVDTSQKTREINGRIVMTFAHIMLLEPIEDNGEGGVGRQEPIDMRDVFVLPNGATGPVVDLKDPALDPATNHAYFYEVWLGAITERGTLL